jgi:hypothetical protein
LGRAQPVFQLPWKCIGVNKGLLHQNGREVAPRPPYRATANISVAFDACKCYYSPCFHQMGLVRAETVDLYRGGLPINPLPARKGKTFD